MKKLAKLLRSERGAVIIELAMAAPVLATMAIGVIDISIAYGKKLQLEQAAQRAIEKVAQTTGEDTLSNTIKTEAVCQYNGVSGTTCKTAPITATNVTVTFKLTCDGVNTTWTLDCTGGQTEVRYITTKVEDTYTPMFPLHFGTAADGKYHLSATAGVRVV